MTVQSEILKTFPAAFPGRGRDAGRPPPAAFPPAFPLTKAVRPRALGL